MQKAAAEFTRVRKKIYKKVKSLVKHPIEYLLIITIFKLLSKLGIDKSAEVCSKIMQFIGPFLKYDKIARKNLENVFGQTINLEETMQKLWENCGFFIGEFPFVKTMSQEGIDKRTEVLGVEHIQKLVDKNQPFIFFTGHFANWELALRLINKIHSKFAIIYSKSNNKFISKYISDSRGDSSYLLVPKGTQGAKDLVKAIKSGYSIGMLVDQKLYEGMEVPFFGRNAKTAIGPAELYLKYNYPLIPFQIIRTKGSNFKFIIHQPLEIKLTGNKETDVYNILLKINQTLESWIIEHKEQWLWFHERW